jgi:hypothetical protein
MINKKTILSLILTISSTQVFAVPGGSAQNASTALKHSGKAVSHTAASAGQLVSGVVAVPLLVIGSAGSLSAAAGETLWDTANDRQPLSITDKTITIDPMPQQALRKSTQQHSCELSSNPDHSTEQSESVNSKKKQQTQLTQTQTPRQFVCMEAD